MNYRERPLVMTLDGEELVGVVTLPEEVSETGVLIVVGGPQYRAGSHRQFIALARRLAASGVAAMRFDYRGMGDSSGERRSFEHVDGDIDAAVTAFLAQVPGLRRVVLWGLCDGASAALLYWQRRHDRRLGGLCLVNPWVRSDATLARTTIRHYYPRRLLAPAFWKKLLSGRLDLRRSLGELYANLSRSGAGEEAPPQDFNHAMAEAFQSFPGRLLVLISGNDMTGQEFMQACRSDPRWMEAMSRSGVVVQEVPGADHTFSSAAWRGEAERLTLQWLLTP